jgi:hypothetical protein
MASLRIQTAEELIVNLVDAKIQKKSESLPLFGDFGLEPRKLGWRWALIYLVEKLTRS